jgi:uncharacterized protein YuzE
MIECKYGLIVLDFDKKGQLLGVEVIGARRLPSRKTIASVEAN